MINKIIDKIFNPQPTAHNPQPNSGQIVLMLVLITIVGLTIGLSLISRTITDLRITSQTEQSNRAFSAAEAGVENALKGAVIGGPTGTVNLPSASGSYSVSQVGGTDAAVIFPLTSPSELQTVWFADHDTDGALIESSGMDPKLPLPNGLSYEVCWGTDGNNNSAIVLFLYYKDSAGYKFARSAFDNFPNSHSPGNNFNPPDGTGSSGYCGGTYRFHKTINVVSDYALNLALNPKLLFLQIQPVYEKTTLAIKPNISIPGQGKMITSVGQTETGVVRKIQVTQGYNVLPAIFNFTLFTETKL